MQTIDNLLTQGKIDIIDYLERVPDGYIAKKQELIEKIKSVQRQAQMPTDAPGVTPGRSGFPAGGGAAARPDIGNIPVTGGFGQLQRALNEAVATNH